MKLLITGAYGQLGNEIKVLSENYKEWDFIFTDVDLLDITDRNAVAGFLNETKPDFVINCAAYTAVDKAEADIEAANRINAIAPGIIANITKQIGAKMIHISTDYVFGGKAFRPLVETDKVSPRGIYAKSKLVGEQNCVKENLDSVIIRTSWLYSTFGNNFVKTMLRLGKERSSVNVVFDQIGTPTYAADLAKAILDIVLVLKKEPERYLSGIYHYSNEGVASWYDFAKVIFEISGIDCRVFPILSEAFITPVKRPEYSVLDKSKIKNTFGIEIPFWIDSLKFCIANMRK
ncbi:MAG: dTDP-4-dehydrorhamnose reductase [Bacteroidales bacterium]|jgi:dTDP-4-dehydrorhamnose reductase|nr:dTDP-4-dehydrorhamnose reductase [Bacteroidales bacterium]